MSLILNRSYEQPDAFITSKGNSRGFTENSIRIGEHHIDVEDFAEVVIYFFTNTDLEEDDIRYDLLARIKSLKEIKGYNGDNVRFSEENE